MLYGWLVTDDTPPIPAELLDALEHYRAGALTGALAPGENSVLLIVQANQHLRERVRLLEELLVKADNEREGLKQQVVGLVQQLQKQPERALWLQQRQG